MLLRASPQKSPQKSPRQDIEVTKTSLGSNKTLLAAVATACVVSTTVFALLGPDWYASHNGGGHQSRINTGSKTPKQLSQIASCQPDTWRLRNQNWTDGDPSVPDAGICSWHNQMEAPGPADVDCTSQIGVPKVAMLFLTMGQMRHETLWSLWFKQAAAQIPLDCLQSAICGPEASARLPSTIHSCLNNIRPGILQHQHLFSVYVHPPPHFEPYDSDSLFHGTEVSNRINSSWGTFDLVQVARILMAEALLDPLNQRFMTISESCIPLYPPAVVYYQLMYAEKSRINGCTTREDWRRDEYRWTWRLEEMTGGRLTKSMWRKNHQWLALTRKHARLAVADQEISAAFAKHCYSGKDPDFGGWWRTCFSDEHYFSTLLAFHGLDEETDCMGELTHTFWCFWCSGDERLHPKTYTAEETNVKLLKELRQEEGGCNASAALEAAAFAVRDPLRPSPVQACQNARPPDVFLLEPKCPIFARKFSDDSQAGAMHAVFSMLLSEEVQLVRQYAACGKGEASTSSTAVSDGQFGSLSQPVDLAGAATGEGIEIRSRIGDVEDLAVAPGEPGVDTLEADHSDSAHQRTGHNKRRSRREVG